MVNKYIMLRCQYNDSDCLGICKWGLLVYSNVQYLHDCIISLRGQVWDHKTILTLPLFIGVYVPRQERERSCTLYICGMSKYLACRERDTLCTRYYSGPMRDFPYYNFTVTQKMCPLRHQVCAGQPCLCAPCEPSPVSRRVYKTNQEFIITLFL